MGLLDRLVRSQQRRAAHRFDPAGCLDHVLVLGERHLRRTLGRYFEYYHQAHTHLALDKDAPDIRPIQLPEAGTILQIPRSRRSAPSLRPPGSVVHHRRFSLPPNVAPQVRSACPLTPHATRIPPDRAAPTAGECRPSPTTSDEPQSLGPVNRSRMLLSDSNEVSAKDRMRFWRRTGSGARAPAHHSR